MSLIELKNINKIYQTGTIALRALKDVSLVIDSLEMVAIVGVSGSGKSTMMNIIGLLDLPTSGKFLLNGKQVSLIAEDELAEIRNKTIGFVFQSFFLLPRLKALQNVVLPLLYRGYNFKKALKTAENIMAKLGISHLCDNKPNQMSGGEQQRVAIARALIGNPEIILADEPTGSLDTKTGREIMSLFAKLHEIDHKTVIIITHDQSISEQCGRIITLQDGRIINDETN